MVTDEQKAATNSWLGKDGDGQFLIRRIAIWKTSGCWL